MAGNRPKQPAYETFSIECGFQQSKSKPSTVLSRWVAQTGIKEGYPS